MRVLALCCLISTAAFSADSMVFGPVTKDLQLGLAIDSTPVPALRVVIRNRGTSTQGVLIGHKGQKQPLYAIDFEATTLDGKRHSVVNLLVLREPPSAGLVLPEIAYIQPQSAFEMTFLLKDLDNLPGMEWLHSIRASFETMGKPDVLDATRMKNLWIGKLSVELILAKH